MTTHKPFTNEELDELARLNRQHTTLSLADTATLIAQAREEIRLREAIDSVLTDTRSLEEILSGVTDPTARAKRELGEWLSSCPHRSWARYESTEPDEVRIVLSEWSNDVSRSDWVPLTVEHEAILSALAKAKNALR